MMLGPFVLGVVVIVSLVGRVGRRRLRSRGGRAGGEPRRFIGQREERVALGAGKPAAALFAREERGKSAGKQQTEEDGDRYDGHAWNACPEYPPKRAG